MKKRRKKKGKGKKKNNDCMTDTIRHLSIRHKYSFNPRVSQREERSFTVSLDNVSRVLLNSKSNIATRYSSVF